MNGFIDLHTHSYCSDGTCSPTELVKLASSIGLKAIALTDHDTAVGLAEFKQATEQFPEVEVIGGVEISSRFCGREMHIVGLWVDDTCPELSRFLANMRQERARRNEEIRLKLNHLGYIVSWDDPEFSDIPDAGSIGRPHFARVLMRKYNFPTPQSVFDKLLKRGCPAYVPRKLVAPAEAISVIHAAGGVAIWAHPIYRERNERAWARRIMKQFKPLGLDAIEAYYSQFGPVETKMLIELAKEFDFALSGGSDFHGENSPGITLGRGGGKLQVPAEILEELRKRRPIPPSP